MSNILLISATKLEHHDKELFGIPIHIIGVGKVNAAVNTYKLIQKYNPDYVVNFGSCGNLKNHKVGEVLEVGGVWDDFFTGDTGIEPHPGIKLSDSEIQLFSTDTFYVSSLTHHVRYKYYIDRCDLVDMEGYSIAKVCKDEKISLSLYKWVSDDGSTDDWQANAAVGYENFKIKFKKWLEQQK
jgi:adenosylhomocysteine nucleosidase